MGRGCGLDHVTQSQPVALAVPSSRPQGRKSPHAAWAGGKAPKDCSLEPLPDFLKARPKSVPSRVLFHGLAIPPPKPHRRSVTELSHFTPHILHSGRSWRSWVENRFPRNTLANSSISISAGQALSPEGGGGGCGIQAEPQGHSSPRHTSSTPGEGPSPPHLPGGPSPASEARGPIQDCWGGGLGGTVPQSCPIFLSPSPSHSFDKHPNRKKQPAEPGRATRPPSGPRAAG